MQIILIATAVMTQDYYARLTGLMEGRVGGRIEKGYRPSLKIGRVHVLYIAALSQQASDQEEWQ